MSLIERATREQLRALEPYSSKPEFAFAAKKLSSAHPSAAIKDFVDNSEHYNSYSKDEMVSTISDIVPFAKVVQGPYVNPEGDKSDGPFYTLRDSNGFWQVSGKNISGIPDDKASQINLTDSGVANVALDFGELGGVRFVPLMKALRHLSDSLMSEDGKVKLSGTNSTETKEVISAYLKALNANAQVTKTTYPNGTYGRRGDDQLARLHAATN